MSIKVLLNKLGRATGRDALPLLVVKEQYLDICSRANWIPTNEGLVEFNTLLNNKANWRRA